MRSQRFRQGLKDIKTLAEGYYAALAGLAPGSGAVVATWDIHNGNYLGAALAVAFSLPLGKIARHAIESTGTIAIGAGDKLVAAVPVKVFRLIERMPEDQQKLLGKRLTAAKTEGEVASIIDDFLGTQFHRHHPLAKFLGGAPEQLLSTIPKSVHAEFMTSCVVSYALPGSRFRLAPRREKLRFGGSTSGDMRARRKSL